MYPYDATSISDAGFSLSLPPVQMKVLIKFLWISQYRNPLMNRSHNARESSYRRVDTNSRSYPNIRTNDNRIRKSRFDQNHLNRYRYDRRLPAYFYEAPYDQNCVLDWLATKGDDYVVTTADIDDLLYLCSARQYREDFGQGDDLISCLIYLIIILFLICIACRLLSAI